MTTKWVRVCNVDDVDMEDLIRFEVDNQSFIVIRSPDDEFFATDGHCTHEAIHLGDGLVMDYEIECPKHNGTFDYRTGEALAPPVCVNLKTFKTKVEDGSVFLEVPQ